MVPGLALQSRDSGQLFPARGLGRHERDVAGLGQNEQQALVIEQQNLASAIAALFPTTFARIKVDANKEGAIEALSRNSC